MLRRDGLREMFVDDASHGAIHLVTCDGVAPELRRASEVKGLELRGKKTLEHALRDRGSSK